jgi:hypothetical protein
MEAVTETVFPWLRDDSARAEATVAAPPAKKASRGFWGWLSDVASDIWGWCKKAWNWTTDKVQDGWHWTKDHARDFWGWAKDHSRSFWNGSISFLTWLSRPVQVVLMNLAGLIIGNPILFAAILLFSLVIMVAFDKKKRNEENGHNGSTPFGPNGVGGAPGLITGTRELTDVMRDVVIPFQNSATDRRRAADSGPRQKSAVSRESGRLAMFEARLAGSTQDPQEIFKVFKEVAEANLPQGKTFSDLYITKSVMDGLKAADLEVAKAWEALDDTAKTEPASV